MNLSVIVPAYNAQATIGQTLKALKGQDYQGQYEIIIVDDGSSDQTAQIIRSFPDIIYLHQPNSGPACARNTGAKQAKSQVLAFTDADCIPHQDWLSRLMDALATPDVAVVMGSYGIANPSSQLARCVHKEILFRHERLLTQYPKVFGSYNFCVLKKVFDEVGGFNPLYKNASGEDNDLSYKIISSGFKIYFERKALVDHHHPTQISRYLKEQFRHGFWRANMYFSHPKMARGDGYTFWKDILEVPLSLCCLFFLLLIFFDISGAKELFVYLILFFLLFEIYFARMMLHNFSSEIFWGFIMFLRSFARTLGLSTGILCFMSKKNLNKP